MSNETKPADKAGKTRTKSTPETAKSVNLSLQDDEETHAKLLNILKLNQHNNRGIHIPLSGALRFAVHAAHTMIYGEEFDENTEGAFDAYLERLEAVKAGRRTSPPPQRHQADLTPVSGQTEEPPKPRPVSSQTGKTPGQLAREAAESKSDEERGIGKPPAPKTQ